MDHIKIAFFFQPTQDSNQGLAASPPLQAPKLQTTPKYASTETPCFCFSPHEKASQLCNWFLWLHGTRMVPNSCRNNTILTDSLSKAKRQLSQKRLYKQGNCRPDSQAKHTFPKREIKQRPGTSSTTSFVLSHSTAEAQRQSFPEPNSHILFLKHQPFAASTCQVKGQVLLAQPWENHEFEAGL